MNRILSLLRAALLFALLVFAGLLASLPPVRAQINSLFSVTLMNAAGATSAQFAWPGGQGVFIVDGTFGGGTVTLQFVGPDGSTLITAGAATTFTANGAGVFYLPQCKIQATVTGATGASLYAKAQVLPIVVQ